MQSKITVEQGVEEYLAYRAARFAVTTVKQEGYVLRRFAVNVGQHRQVRYLQAKVVSDWFYGAQGVMAEHRTRDQVTRPGVQASTHNYYRNRLKSSSRSGGAEGTYARTCWRKCSLCESCGSSGSSRLQYNCSTCW